MENILIGKELSNRELEILNLIAKGLTSEEIADKLFLSKNTIITHRARISKKLNVKRVPNLLMKAMELNLIE